MPFGSFNNLKDRVLQPSKDAAQMAKDSVHRPWDVQQQTVPGLIDFWCDSNESIHAFDASSPQYYPVSVYTSMALQVEATHGLPGQMIKPFLDLA
ncbi:vesicular glutamate transporter [Elysia marginata]|uniref:Vesicular glutamate transporter n=1 Tax=Elysia marginata TaxID=1093978 RepID=A0AAV4F7I3_9GAST|nr:vesicular glutamate transporter [Elysia marginata]